MAPLSHLSPPAKLVFLLMIVLTGFLLVLVLGILLAWPLFNVNMISDMALLSDIGNPAVLSLLKFLQILQSIGLFIIPPLAVGYFFGKNPFKYLKMNTNLSVHVLGLTLLMLFVSLPLINWMITLNETMNLPEFLRGVEAWMKEAEEQAAALTEAFLSAETPGDYLLNLFMIAVIPAIGEELMFRGVLQRIFGEWFRNVHVAIFVSAFLFGAIHMQFYGFFPRMMLGVAFGYLFYWSGSVWLPIFAHFINNASAVTASFLSQKKMTDMNYEDFGATDNIVLIILSTLVTAIILYLIYLRSVKDQKKLLNEN